MGLITGWLRLTRHHRAKAGLPLEVIHFSAVELVMHKQISITWLGVAKSASSKAPIVHCRVTNLNAAKIKNERRNLGLWLPPPVFWTLNCSTATIACMIIVRKELVNSAELNASRHIPVLSTKQTQ